MLIKIWLIIIIGRISALSYNQPKFCSIPTWNPNAITVANESIIGAYPSGIFVNSNNSIYVTHGEKSTIHMWHNDSINPTKTISVSLANLLSIFVTVNGDIYVSGRTNSRVDKQISNTNISVAFMCINGSCYGLFVDVNDTLYCSLYFRHQVVKKWLNDSANTSVITAGDGTNDSTPTSLSSPWGIFVDINLDLYVADYGNNRIQLFRSGEVNATTVAGSSSPNTTISLFFPTGIVLDADGYLFIVDSGNHRIVGSGPNGFRCIVGCSDSLGLASNQLSHPGTFSFDSYGNMFVNDRDNHRIQKFLLENRFCNETTIIATTTTISTTTTSKTFPVDQICSSPEIRLIPESSSSLEFRRNQDLYILSIIKLNCNKSILTNKKWIIKNATTSNSYEISFDKKIILSNSELYIPSNILPYGKYQLNLMVTMTVYPNLKNSTAVYIEISPSGIIANLFQLGTSVVTSGYQQDLKLNPGNYSFDPDALKFNATDWIYIYFCRIYGIDGPLLNLNKCLSNNKTKWNYTGVTHAIESSVTIYGNSLEINQKYQFIVYMSNRRNATPGATGYVIVEIVDSNRTMIAIGCVIWSICTQNLEFQKINPTTQVALYSYCTENCPTSQNISWNIYYGIINSTWNLTKWIQFDPGNIYGNIWLFGKSSTNFTAVHYLFINNPDKTLWKFEVIYTFGSVRSLSALNFEINQPPYNGSCQIDPSNGTTTTVFRVTCSDWYNQDNIKDYSLYYWKEDRSKLKIISCSPVSIFDVRLPVGNNLNLVIHIRDTLDSIGEFNLSSINVTTETNSISKIFQKSTNELMNNSLIQSLATENQNTIGQVISLLSEEFNQINNQTMETAISNGIPLTSISISSLESSAVPQNPMPLNETALLEYNKQLNIQANVLEYLIKFTKDLTITSVNSVKLQSLSLVQLTNPINQLTRTTLMIASEQCYQLTRYLYSKLTQIPYEDIKIASTQLLQCASNVLTGVNGPLQQRTSALDSDISSATKVPDDYDTDIELEWANPNLFADGSDFSWETIEKGRIIYYQKKFSNEITLKMNETISLLTSILNIHLNIGQNFTINTPEIFMSLETITVRALLNKRINQTGNAQIFIPSNFNLNNTQTISLRSIMEPLASHGKIQANTNLSRSISLSILDQYGNEIPIQTNISNPIEIIIPRDPNLIIPPMILSNVTSIQHNQSFYFHYINLTSILPISVHIEIDPFNQNLSYLLIYKFDQYSLLNNSIDGWTLLCPLNLTNENLYTYFINNQQTINHRSVSIGLRELNSSEMNEYCSNLSLINPSMIDSPLDFTSNYKIRIYTSGCYYLDENNQWKSDGLIVGPLTNLQQTHCYSTHLTTFSGSLRIFPPSLNLDDVLANTGFIQNKTIYLTVICANIIYIILIIYARRQDKKDLEKLGVTPLDDNRRSDHYYYQIIVFTGQRKNAGTQSNVHFVLSGNKDQTYVRTFSDSHRKILQRGGVDAFIMAVSKSLGLLDYIHIWHDNSGEGSSASWFLKYIIVRDLQTMEKFDFISQRWFAVEKDDGKIERVIPAAGEMEKEKFSYILSKQTYSNMSDDHLWFSIFSRPVSNKFTRVQRCTCCFVLFFVSMLLNIMYYGLIEEEENESTNSFSLTFGPFLIRLQQIIIGVIIEFFSLISSLLLVQFFRRIKSRQHRISPLQKTLIELKPNSQLKNNEKKSKLDLSFPWWCIFIAYGISFIIVVVCILMIIAYGIALKELKSQKWLTSILTGLFSSIFLTQPMKVLGLSIFISLFFKNSNKDKQGQIYLDDYQIQLNSNEEYIHVKKSLPSIYQIRIRENRLNEAERLDARYYQLKEMKMWKIVQEFLTYSVYLLLLCLIIYSNNHSNSYLQVKHLRNYFLNSRQIDNNYLKISTINEYWNWLENSLILNLRAQKWYNQKDEATNLTGFINDKSNRLIGWATMRQLRIKSNLCSNQRIISICGGDYNFLNEEKDSFQPKWIDGEEYSTTILKSFKYQSGDELDSYISIGEHETYNSGGYVYEFRGSLSNLKSNISKLHQLGWIDERTRAIIIQISLYNPNVQLFTSVTFLVEFLSTSSIHPSARFEPIHFDAFQSSSQLICLILYLIMIFYLIWIEIERLYEFKWKYFSSFWSFIDLGIIICSWTILGIYIWRYKEFQRISQLFKQTNGYVYINLQLSTYINDLLTYFYGFCCFFGTIKFIRLCRMKRRISLFIQTLEYAGKELGLFSMMFSFLFFSFVCLFYLLFISKISSCSTLLKTSQMLFEIILCQFNGKELIEISPFLGPLCFSLFIILIVLICMNMFISIVNDNFHRARDNRENDEELFSFMLTKFFIWSGLKKLTELEIAEERDKKMRSKYLSTTDYLPIQVEQLCDAIDRIYD